VTSVVGVVASTPIDEFLAGAGRSSASGARLETLGVGLGLVGTVVVLGLLVLLAAVHVGPRSEVRTLLVIAMAGGAVMLFGGAVEIAGTAEVLGIGWTDALTDASASSAMLRLLGGLLVVLGLGDETVAADPGDDASAAHRWVPGATSAFGLVGVALGALSFAFDGHTVSQGPRLLHAGVNLVHVVAGGVWVGGVVGLAVLAARRGRGGSITPLLAPFSRIATIALGAVFVAGVAMAAIILEGPRGITPPAIRRGAPCPVGDRSRSMES
jgi:copper transport protein